MQSLRRPSTAAPGCVPSPPGRTRARRHMKTGLHTNRRGCSDVLLVKPTPAKPAAGTIAVPAKVPTSILDVDSGRTVGAGVDLAEDHPGFHDEAYKQRRLQISNIALQYNIGQPIPRVDYTPEEVGVWGITLSNLRPMYTKYACREFNAALPKLNFREDGVPQLQDVSEALREATGWQVRPAPGLMHPRDFLAGFAFKCFHSTQFVRHSSRPNYSPEPDVVHDVLGHVAMLADPTFAEIAQSIGQASLGADDVTLSHLTRVFWHTLEFGVVREGSTVKAFGAALLSSFGELEHFARGEAELLPLPEAFSPLPRMLHKGGYQPRYFVMDSFEAGLENLRKYAAAIGKGS